MNKHKILYKLIAMFTIVILLNAININTTKAITMNAYPMTDSNFNIWGDSVQTTFSDKGYFSVLNVNGTEANIKNCSGSLNGVSVQTKLSYISNGNYVKISFEATNTSGSAKTIGIATYADIQIADNDYAPITNLSGNRGFTMTDGTKYTFTFLGRNSYGVTDVDTYWFGQFQIREENKWNNSQTYVYGSTTERQGDSGMAFSWKNRTIQNGEKLIFSVAIGIGTLNTPPTIRVTSQLKNSYYQGEVVDVQGYVNDIDNGDIVIVKYAIDGGEEMVIANNLRPNGSEKYFHTSFTIPNNISNGQHFFQVWAADNCGNMSVPVTVYFNVNKDVTAPTGTHSINPTNWTNGDVTITLNTTDDMSGVKRIKKPDGSYIYSVSTIYVVPANGSYTFVLEDNVGNTRNYTVTINNIDKTAPTGSLSHNPTQWVNTDVKIHWSVADANSGVKQIKLPDGTIKTTATGDYTVSQNGTYTFVVYDVAGNTLTLQETVTNIDKTPPTGSLSHNPTDWVIDYVKIHWTASDSQSGFNRVVLPDGTSTTNASGDFTVTDNGTYTFTLYDNVGNSRILTENINNIDKIMPEGVLSLQENRLTDEKIKISWKAFDLQSGFSKILLPDSTFSTNATGEFTVSQMGDYSFVIYDKVGNTRELSINVSNVDMINPILEVTQDTDKWTNGEITLNWKADDYQSGLQNVILPSSENVTDKQGSYIVTENGNYIFLAYDKIGNGILVEHQVTNIDKINPNLDLTVDSADDGGIQISWVSSDEQSGISNITLPDGKRVTNSSGSIEIYENGVYSFIAYDNAGNATVKDVTIDSINNGSEIKLVLYKEAIDSTHWRIKWQITEGKDKFAYIVLPNGTFSYEPEGSHIVTGGNAEYTFLAYDKKGNENIGTIAVSY
ncbi:MAG: hypothetical protein BHW09_08500 [Clostridium sp. CAG:245_30_32]|nr:MAG: hypothetical protein BHW09_08500 [Clostridium sp. CAG:245_30_32]